MISRRTALLLAIIVFAIAAPMLADANPTVQPTYKGIMDAFHTAATQWQGTLSTAALTVFWYLAGIEFCWVNITLALRGGDFSDFVSTNTKLILTIGVFLAFLQNAFVWSEAVVNSFHHAGQTAVQASGGNPGPIGMGVFDPAGVLQEGLILGSEILRGASTSWNPVSILIIGLGGIIIVLCFCYLAAIMAVAVIETYVVGGGIVLLLGFGGSSWTSDIARRAMMFAFSAGAKLFVIELIIGSAISAVNQWVSGYGNGSIADADGATCFGLIGIAFLVCILAKQVPELVQAMLNGSAIGHSSALSTFAAGGAAMAALASGGVAAAGLGASGAASGAGGHVGVSEGILSAAADAALPSAPLGMGKTALGEKPNDAAQFSGPLSGLNTQGAASTASDAPSASAGKDFPSMTSPVPGAPASSSEGPSTFRGKTAGGHMADAVGHIADVATGINPVQRAGGVGMPQLGKGKSADDNSSTAVPSSGTIPLSGEAGQASPGVRHDASTVNDNAQQSPVGGSSSTIDERASNASTSASSDASPVSAGVRHAAQTLNDDVGSSPSGGLSATIDERASDRSQYISSVRGDSSLDAGSLREAFSPDRDPGHGPAAPEPSSALTEASSGSPTGIDDPSLRVPLDPMTRTTDRDLANDNRYEADQSAFDRNEDTRLARESGPAKPKPENS